MAARWREFILSLRGVLHWIKSEFASIVHYFCGHFGIQWFIIVVFWMLCPYEYLRCICILSHQNRLSTFSPLLLCKSFDFFIATPLNSIRETLHPLRSNSWNLYFRIYKSQFCPTSRTYGAYSKKATFWKEDNHCKVWYFWAS